MKKYLSSIILIILLVLVIINIDKISNYTTKLISNFHKVVVLSSNEYKKDYDFEFIQNVDEFSPYSYNDLLNILYTTINNGWEKFTFYCPSEYKNCIQDTIDISKQELLLAEINNYVSPFNSFKTCDIYYDETGEITIDIKRVYEENDIKMINEKIDEIIKNNINDEMELEVKLRTLHDYIINNTIYDVERNKDGVSKYQSNTAYGPLFDGYATCNGYADVYAIILDKLNVKNYRIASSKHIWNAVYIEDKNEWLHIDLTWDDPVSEDGKNYLYDTYFLKTTKEIKKADGKRNIHIFDKLVYLEFNE